MILSKFFEHYRNARIVVKEIKEGKWLPLYGPPYSSFLTAQKAEGGLELLLHNGPFFTDLIDIESGYGQVYKNHFGSFWRHYVWWAAARKLSKTKVMAPKLGDRLTQNVIISYPATSEWMAKDFLKPPVTKFMTQKEIMDIAIRGLRANYFANNPADTWLAMVFNDLLKVNGTYELDLEKNRARTENAKNKWEEVIVPRL